MSVESARRAYVDIASQVGIECPLGWPCRLCGAFYLRVEAASIRLDNAVAEACREREDERLIAGVAWA